MARYCVQRLARHHAAADALATAQLLLRLWPALAVEKATTWGTVAKLAAAGRWVVRPA